MTLTTTTITILSVNQSMKGQYSVVWELKGFDESEIELFSQTFSEDYKTGDSPTRVETGFIEQMQDYIDKYKAEKVILEHVQMANAITNVLSALVL